MMVSSCCMCSDTIDAPATAASQQQAQRFSQSVVGYLQLGETLNTICLTLCVEHPPQCIAVNVILIELMRREATALEMDFLSYTTLFKAYYSVWVFHQLTFILRLIKLLFAIWPGNMTRAILHTNPTECREIFSWVLINSTAVRTCYIAEQNHLTEHATVCNITDQL